jgi:Big-like domain-containing protein/parallel beta helix pectate lyase-like protein
MINQIVVGRLSALFLALALVSAQGADYYVSTQGSDSNPGTSAQPFRTITRAYGLAGPGTTIIVLPGVYTDYQSGWGLHLGRSGTASSPITLRSQVRGGAIIDGQNASDRNVAIYLDGSYNIVDGFEIRGGPLGGITIWGNYNQILNNKIHHNGNPASTSPLGQDGIYSGENTRDTVYRGNTIHDNGRTGSNLDHALYLCGDNEVVINNVLIRNAAYGVHIAGYTTVSNMKVYNNVMAHNGKSGIILWMPVSGVDIKNNIIYQNGKFGIDSYDAHGSGVVIDRNLVFGNSLGNYGLARDGSDFTYTLGTTISSAPLFVNSTSAGFDAHLSAGSPAINAALNLSSVFTTDLDGALRPASGSWDLGAYKYGNADTTAPTISLTAPANNATVSGVSVTVSANASDNVGVAGVQFKLNGANLGAEDTTAPYSVTLNTMTLANGTHTLTAVARDAAGNQTTASSRSIIVSNPPPSVALTSPVNGASYTAPATINLAASVVANGHTITRVQFFNGTTLLGEDLTAPYSFTWNSVTAGSYSLSARAVYGGGSMVASTATSVSVSSAPPPSSLTLAATSGAITAPFVAVSGTISQPAYTGVTAGGRAAYTFTISTAGEYLVSAQVNAPNDSANSLFVNIDAEPADPTMIWDIPVTSGLTERTVSWRGSGTFDSAQFAPKVFNLSAGTHTLIVRGREANCQLGNITIRPK